VREDVAGPHLEIVDLARDVSRRTFMPVTFTLAKAGRVTLDVWVQALHPSMTDSAGSP
jgi:hypothetical protein